MKNRELKELKNDKNISPEDVANFALYDNDISDINKYTAICDLVVCCERSQTAPLKQQIKELEAERDKYREALQNIVDYENRGRDNGEPRISDHWFNIAEQALNQKDNG